MGSAYTPGLKVTRSAVLRRTRRLPIKGSVLVEFGSAVEPGTVVARALLPGLMQSVKVAAQLGVEPSDLAGVLKVKEGDTVEKGQQMASTQAFFGLFKSDVKSPVSGTVETISSVSGNVGVRQAPIPVELSAYISGTVAEVLPGEGVIVETHGALVQGIFGVGGERVGQIHVATASVDVPLTEADIKPEHAGKILIGGSSVTGGALRKAAAGGVIGIVVGAIVDKDLIAYLGYDIGVAITGHELIPITVVITEGFGSIPMAQRTFDLLKSLEGKTASINGATQIRAGVIRPEVIVPLPGNAVAPDTSATSGVLDIGVPIRIIREPYFGQLATVAALPSKLTKLASGAMVRVLDATLSDSRTVTVPRANVEIIETV